MDKRSNERLGKDIYNIERVDYEWKIIKALRRPGTLQINKETSYEWKRCRKQYQSED